MFEKKVLVARRTSDGKFAARWNDGHASGFEWVDNPIVAAWAGGRGDPDLLRPAERPAYYFSPRDRQNDAQWNGVEMVVVIISAAVVPTAGE